VISLSENGFPKGHKPDCGCPACQGHQAAEARRLAEAEQAATVRAMARAVVQLLARGAQSGPDALRSLIGEADAIRVLRLAGLNAGVVAANWQASVPVTASAHQSRTAAMWAASPDHDPRVTQVLTRPGSTMAEVAAVRAQVAGEYAGRQLERQAREQSSVLWRTRSGVVADGQAPVTGASYGPSGAPAQRSQVHGDVAELGSEV
jgi:hypothetical protein